MTVRHKFISDGQMPDLLSSLWGSSNLLADLEDLHIRAARLIHNISISIPKHEVVSMAKWSSIHHMYKRRLACIAHQTFHNLAPDDINSLFTKHQTSYNFKRDNLNVLNPKPCMFLLLIMLALFGIAYLVSYGKV